MVSRKEETENYFTENCQCDPRQTIKKILVAAEESVKDLMHPVLNRQFPSYDVWNENLDKQDAVEPHTKL